MSGTLQMTGFRLGVDWIDWTIMRGTLSTEGVTVTLHVSRQDTERGMVEL